MSAATRKTEAGQQRGYSAERSGKTRKIEKTFEEEGKGKGEREGQGRRVCQTNSFLVLY